MKNLVCIFILVIFTVSAYSQSKSVEDSSKVELAPVNIGDGYKNGQNLLTVESKENSTETSIEIIEEPEANESLKAVNEAKFSFYSEEFQKNDVHKRKLLEFHPPKENNDDKKSDEVQTNRRAKWEIEENSIEYGVEIGYAPDIATWMSGPKPWDISGHRHFLGSFRYGKILGTRGIVTFSYAIEFIPISLAIGNETENKEFRTNPNVPPTKRTTNYGFALNPVSFRFIFFPKLRLRPFIFAGLGPSYHFKPVPIPSGTKWNLQFDFGIGGQYMLSRTRAVQFGYRYYHLSNVYLSDYNPGYNTNVYFVGYSFFKK